MDEDNELNYLEEIEHAEREARLHELNFNEPTRAFDYEFAEYGEPA